MKLTTNNIEEFYFLNTKFNFQRLKGLGFNMYSTTWTPAYPSAFPFLMMIGSEITGVCREPSSHKILYKFTSKPIRRRICT